MNDVVAQAPVVTVPTAVLGGNPEQLGQLFAALAKAQGAIRAAKADSANTFFKTNYADLASCWDACRAPLADNNLCIIQTTDSADEEIVIVRTTLGHAGGGYVSTTLRMTPQKSDPQGIGSCITYGRRYGLCAMVGIAQEDDDGTSVSTNQAANEKRYITTKQAEELSALIKATDTDEKEFCKFFGGIENVFALDPTHLKRAQTMLSKKAADKAAATKKGGEGAPQ